MPVPLSNLVVAALAVGGLATGVGTASASTTSPTLAQVAAEQAQEQQLRSDIGTLTTTEEHLQSTLRNRMGTPSGAPPVDSSAPLGVHRSPESGSGTAITRGTQSTTTTTGSGSGSGTGTGSVSGPFPEGGSPTSTSAEPTTGPPMTEPPTTNPPTTTTTNPPPTTTTNPGRGGDGGGD